ncbi:YggS family pyridoxal phosphate-dependent enzyme [Calditerricola yamamurae]
MDRITASERFTEEIPSREIPCEVNGVTLAERLAAVKRRIQEACRRSGRREDEVTLVAVTKYVDAETVRALLDAGVTDVGENRVQDAVPKWEALGGRGVWHFIGRLQTNKVKDVVGRFAYIHSLDRMTLAEELEKRARQKDTVVRCFLQVNVSGEATKAGVHPDELVEFAREVAKLSRLRVVGLMTMAPIVDDPEETRPVFRALRELRDALRDQGIPGVDPVHLSMGMSGDFEVAVEEGATFVRIGSLLYKPDPGTPAGEPGQKEEG